MQTDSLDVTFNLKSGKHWPCCKPNVQPLYANARSNHPPMIKEQLPTMLSKRISELSCNSEDFANAATTYNIAMKKRVHREGLAYDDYAIDTRARTKNRKRIIVRMG